MKHFFKIYGLSLFVLLLNACSKLSVLDPKGPIGQQEKFLILISIGLMLIVVVPVFVLAIWFAIRYRAGNTKATFKPDWEGSNRIEAVIWLIPISIVVVLSILAWTHTIKLDPYNPISSDKAPVRVQVVSLDWNWLFIYPDYDIATVNELVIPSETPISFDLTSATVMTSFFIPRLGSQMYAMAGMVTHLNLLASEPGTYTGQNQEFSGDGYHTMHFPAIAKSPEEFSAWVDAAKESQETLSLDTFQTLNTPQSDYPVTTYASVAPGLFDHIVGQFMDWMGDKAMANMSMDGSMDDTMNNEASSMPMTKDN